MIFTNLKFSVNELKKSVFYMSLTTVICLIGAFITFEGEYLLGTLLENLFERIGVLAIDWLSYNSDLFLHIIQIMFIITFFFEIKLIIVKFTRNWML